MLCIQRLVNMCNYITILLKPSHNMSLVSEWIFFLNGSNCCHQEDVFVYTPGFNLTQSVNACFSMDYRMYGDDDDVLYVFTTNNTLEWFGDYLWEEDNPEDTWQRVQLQITSFGKCKSF